MKQQANKWLLPLGGLLGLTIAVLAVSAFIPRATGPVEYIGYLQDPDNGLNVVAQEQGVNIALQYRPHELVVLQEARPEHVANRAAFDARLANIGDVQYYDLVFSTESGESFLQYNIGEEHDFYTRLDYFNHYFQDDLQLVDGGDTLSCLMYHHERPLGAAPYNHILLAFPAGSDPAATKQLLINERAMGLGRLCLTVEGDAIHDIPELNI